MQAQQAAKLKDEAENPFALPPEKMKDRVHMKKVLLNGLPPILAHEQGIALNSAARVMSSCQVLKSSLPCVVQNVLCRLGAIVNERRSSLHFLPHREKQVEVAANACMDAASSNSCGSSEGVVTESALHNHHGGSRWLA